MVYILHWSRESLLAAIEESSGIALAASDPLPDTLIATAQELGMSQSALKLWIYDWPKPQGWTAAALTSWAVAHKLAKPLCAHCGARVDDPEEHTCKPSLQALKS